MKFTTRNLLIFLVIISFASCRSTKDLIYLIDTVDDELLETQPEEAFEYNTIPGDILYISIKSMNEEINKQFNPETTAGAGSGVRMTGAEGAYLYGWEIDEEGNVNLPVLGKVQVVGYTQAEIERIIQERANEFLKESIVKVKLLSWRVTVLGEVGSQGVYYNYSNSFTILQAIALAGGSTDYANIKEVMVLRPNNRGYKVHRMDLSTKRAVKNEAFYLKPNDYVFVEPSKSKWVALNAPTISLP